MATLLVLLVLLPVVAATRIAVIGSGIAGGTAVHFVHTSPFLTSQSLSPIVWVEVFEKESRLGGRVRSHSIDGFHFEAGGAIVHSSNKLLREVGSSVGVSFVRPHRSNSRLAVWDDEHHSIVLTTYNNKYLSILNMLWTFGLDLIRLQSHVDEVKQKFQRFYTLQQRGESFESVSEMLKAADLFELTQVTLKQHLSEVLGRHNSELLRHLVEPVSRVNYGQSSTMSALAGCVSLLPVTGGSDELLVPTEGFAAIPTRLIERYPTNTTHHLQTQVTEIHYHPSNHTHPQPSFTLTSFHHTTNTFTQQHFDFVIIATPLELANITFHNFPAPLHLPHRTFQVTYATFLKGLINAAYFDLSSASSFAATMLTTESTGSKFSSIGCYELDEQSEEGLFKLFSRSPPTDTLLHTLFHNVSQTTTFAWNAYPTFAPPEQFANFKLADGLFYINAFENAVSVMEGEAIAAKNVVMLIEAELKRRQQRSAAKHTPSPAAAEHHEPAPAHSTQPNAKDAL